MASDLNRVMLVGRLTRDPELKSTSAGRFICVFTLASNRTYMKQDGEKVEEVGFFDCVMFGKAAEIISKYARKGKRMGVDGSLNFNRWETSDGQKRSKIDIRVDNFQFLDGGRSDQGDQYSESSPDTGASSYSQPQQSEQSNPVNDWGAGSDEMTDDDIPF